ncbi:MAG: chromosomal replication initiator protein DnaA [Desulfovibrio sp.]|nr:chromosomal replication initiator protein DnaA [Desulfovibrio sp.]
MDTQWQTISAKLQSKLEPGTFRVWIKPLEATMEEGRLRLVAPNAYMAGWVKKRLTSVIGECMHEVCQDPCVLEIGVREKPIAKPEKDSVQQTPKAPVSQPVVRQRTQGILPFSYQQAMPKQTWRFSFADFVEGESNRMAVAAAKEVCRTSSDIQSLYVNATGGLGKTHLVQAVGQDITLKCQHQNVGYMTAEEFSSRYVASIKTNEVESFKESLRGLDVLLLEDIHFLQNKPKIQETALSIVKSLQEKGGRVIFTSSFSPKEMQKVDRAFFSSFCANGIVTHIDKPDNDMRQALIVQKARAAQVKIPDAVCSLLAKRVDGDIRQIESVLQSLIFKAKLLHAKITPALAQDVLEEYVGFARTPDLDLLTSLVCENYGLDQETLHSRSRCQRNVNGRNTIFYLARKYTDLTLKEIGEPFNRRHSTVLQGITSVERELAKDSPLGRQIGRIIGLVEENVGYKHASV